MLPNGAVGEQFVAFGDNLTDWRKVKWIDDFQARRQFPGDEKAADADDAKPVG